MIVVKDFAENRVKLYADRGPPKSPGSGAVLEFKMAETHADVETKMEEAFTQMRDRGYTNRYRDRKEPLHRIAVVCGREARNLLEVRVERAVIT